MIITYREIFSHETAICFKRITQEYGKYLRNGSSAPYALHEKFQNALQEYRDYLDSIGIHMPDKRTRTIFINE